MLHYEASLVQSINMQRCSTRLTYMKGFAFQRMAKETILPTSRSISEKCIMSLLVVVTVTSCGNTNAYELVAALVSDRKLLQSRSRKRVLRDAWPLPMEQQPPRLPTGYCSPAGTCSRQSGVNPSSRGMQLQGGLMIEQFPFFLYEGKSGNLALASILVALMLPRRIRNPPIG